MRDNNNRVFEQYFKPFHKYVTGCTFKIAVVWRIVPAAMIIIYKRTAKRS